MSKGEGTTTTTTIIITIIITTRSWWHGGVGKVKFQQSTQGRSGTGEKETHYINVVGKIKNVESVEIEKMEKPVNK